MASMEGHLADDWNKQGAPDRRRINTSEDYELAYWSKKWSVTADALKAAVKRVGPMAADVARHLGKKM